MSVLPRLVGYDTVVRVFTRAGDTRDGDYVTTAKELRRFARAHRDKNVYVAPNPTCSRMGMRHTAAEVTHWSYFLIDMDPVCACDKSKGKVAKKNLCQTCRGQADPRAALDKALLWLGEWLGWDFSKPGARPIIIDSGRGCQAWIRLEDIQLDDNFGQMKIVNAAEPGGGSTPVVHRSTVRRVNGYWLKKLDERLGLIFGCRIDTSVSDLPRVMRCPGTVNIKTGREACFIEASDYVHRGLAYRLVTGTPVRVLKDPDPPANLEAGKDWQAVFPHLTRMAQSYLSQGQEEPGRHKVMWHTAKKLAELGVSREEARKALKWANKLKGKEARLPLDQVEHALDTAYGG